MVLLIHIHTNATLLISKGKGYGMKVGYVRVSTKEQNTARQDEMMEALSVEKVFTEKVSGKNMNRPQLKAMMEFVRQGDTVVV